MADRELARIAALLRKAESTDNEHEADAYLDAAQRLATLASVDLALARAHTAASERRIAPTQRTISIGEAGRRGLRTYVRLFAGIARANDVMCDVARNSTLVFAYGFEPDLDAVEALYASLVVQMVRASDAFLSSGAHRRETITRVRTVDAPGGRSRSRAQRYEQVPVHTTTARINFQHAFADRVALRLQASRERARQEALDREPPSREHLSRGTALALRNREIELLSHYHATSTARGTWPGNRLAGTYSKVAQRAGDSAGRKARLGGERSIGGSRAQLA